MNPLPQGVPRKIMVKLFQDVNRGNWEEVVKIYKEVPATHFAELTSSGDTALHVAVYNGQESAVKLLAAVVWEKTGRSALEKKNELGHTPLHLAAYLGNAEMCRYLAELDSALMGIRNEDNETPFFVAVQHGRKEAFHALHLLCKPREGYYYYRRTDGETILHSAIAGEYFDLAFDIIIHYEHLVNSVNEQHLSPLHILANKPSCFRSGSHLRGLHKLIYPCVFIDKNVEITRAIDHEYKEGAIYPRNYHTCVGILSLLCRVISALWSHSSEKNDEESNVKDRQHEEETGEHPGAEGSTKRTAQGHGILPVNYTTFSNSIKLTSKPVLLILGKENIREKKRKHIWSIHIMEKLLENALRYEYENEGWSPGLADSDSEIAFADKLPNSAGDPPPENPTKNKAEQNNNSSCGRCGEILCPVLDSMGLVEDNARLKELCPAPGRRRAAAVCTDPRESPILIAAKNGVLEMVEAILERFPVAALDMNGEQKNVVLLAVEHRQPHVYQFLMEWRTSMKETMFKKRDKDGNSALHLAARLGKHRPSLIPALHMQWEIKWYEFVRDSMPLHFFTRHNNLSQTARDIFSKTHGELAKESGAWLTSTSQSCSVVAALIVTVAFPTFATVPGGVKSDNSGIPALQNQQVFSVFAISSLIAFCFSVIAVVMFLALLTSRFEDRDFGIDLPRKLLLGLTSLFISIGSMLLSFCGGHFFVMKEKLQYAAFPVYAITFLPITFFAVAQFPFYFDLVWATISKVPQRSSRE